MTATPGPPLPPLPPDIETKLTEYGLETLTAGMTFEEWSALMVEELGRGVRQRLSVVWATIHRTAAAADKEATEDDERERDDPATGRKSSPLAEHPH